MPEDKGQLTGLAIRYIEPGDGDPRHGTMNGYSNLRCRCTPCTDAWAVYHTAKTRQERPPLPPDDPRHGTTNAYAYWHCRCAICREGRAAAQRAFRKRRAGQANTP